MQGSATVCILVLEGARLHAANLGDSGFWVLRGRSVVHRSPQQQHAFNWPFQLGSPGSRSDTPASADVRCRPLGALRCWAELRMCKKALPATHAQLGGQWPIGHISAGCVVLCERCTCALACYYAVQARMLLMLTGCCRRRAADGS